MAKWPKPGRGAGESIYSSRRIEAKERQLKALELRKTGASFVSIGRELDVSESMARQYVKSAVKAFIPLELIEEIIALENARLDALLKALWPAAMDGHPRSVEVALGVMARRAAMLGLDAPTRIAQTDAAGNDMPFVIEVRSVDEHGNVISAPIEPLALPDAT